MGEVTDQPPKEVDELPPGKWREKYIRNWLSVMLGRRAWMLQKHQEQNRSVQKVAEMARTGGESTEASAEGDDVGVSVGNETHNHYESTTSRSGLGTVGKAALIAAALGAGPVSAGIGAYIMHQSQQGSPVDSEYEVIHRDQNGNIIDVKPWPGTDP